jgi:1,4-alpha-glucan branching enzyme
MYPMVVAQADGSVEFRFYRPAARHVGLAGDFNGWQHYGFPMALGEDGWWRYRLSLSPGTYQFKYFVDGEWYLDYAAFGLEHSSFGLNSVVRVDAAMPKVQAA